MTRFHLRNLNNRLQNFSKAFHGYSLSSCLVSVRIYALKHGCGPGVVRRKKQQKTTTPRLAHCRFSDGFLRISHTGEVFTKLRYSPLCTAYSSCWATTWPLKHGVPRGGRRCAALLRVASQQHPPGAALSSLRPPGVPRSAAPPGPRAGRRRTSRPPRRSRRGREPQAPPCRR